MDLLAKAADLIGLATACVLGALGLLHVYWALVGGETGIAVPEVAGKPLFRPGRLATLLVALALFAAAALVADNVLGFTDPRWSVLVRAACWVLAGIFALRAIGDFKYVGFFKRIRSTRFARLDSSIYSPLCLALAIAVVAATIR